MAKTKKSTDVNKSGEEETPVQREGRTLTIQHTIPLPVGDRTIQLIRGHEYTVVPDREGPPVSELNRTIWETYAAKAEAIWNPLKPGNTSQTETSR
jgi:hypothetical protein